MTIKTILYKLTYRNFRINLSILLALILFLILLSIKAFAHIEFHADINEECQQMLDNAKDIQDKQQAIHDYYDQRRDNIQQWYQDDPYCDKDLRNQLLDKTNQEENEKIQNVKQNYSTV